jgi:hypothetical protein
MKKEVLPAKIFIDSFNTIGYMKFLINMINMFPDGFRTNK